MHDLIGGSESMKEAVTEISDSDEEECKQESSAHSDTAVEAAFALTSRYNKQRRR